MSYYINTKTLEVKEQQAYNDDPTLEWVEYPYSEYDPECYHLISESGDPLTGDQVDYLFCKEKSGRESIDDLNTRYEQCTAIYGDKYDYICFRHILVDVYGFDSFYTLQPFGCYYATKERALQWYKDNSGGFESHRKTLLSFYENKMKRIQKEMDEAAKILNDLKGEIK